MEDEFYLIDAVDVPIRQVTKKDARISLINCWYVDLVDRMRKLVSEDTEVILIKSDVYELRESLIKDGFNVIQ